MPSSRFASPRARLSLVAWALASTTAPSLVHAQAADAAPLPPRRAYEVHANDSCARIARENFTGRDALAQFHALNPELGPTPHHLAAGQTVYLRPEAPAAHAATVTAVARRVTARPRDADAWTAARRGLDLYRGGRVSTEAHASAELTFLDRTVVQLREDTLVVLFGPTSGPRRTSSTETELTSGSLRSRLAELRGRSTPLYVNTVSGVAELHGSSAIVTARPDVSIVSNHFGESRLRRGRERPVRLPPDTGSRVTPTAPPTPPRPLPPAPTFVAGPREFLGVRGAPTEIAAELAPSPVAQRFRFELYADRALRERMAAHEVPATTTHFVARGLAPGAVFLVASVIDAEGYESRPTTLELTIGETVVLAPGETLDAVASFVAPVDTTELEPGEAPRALLAGSRILLPAGVTCTLDDGDAARPRFDLPASATITSCARGEVSVAPPRVVGAPLTVSPITRTGPDGVRFSIEAGAPLPSDLTVQLVGTGSRYIVRSELHVEGGHANIGLTFDGAPTAGSLRITSARTPDRTIALLRLR